MTNKEQLRAEFDKLFHPVTFDSPATKKHLEKMFDWINTNYISKEEIAEIADKQKKIMEKLNS